MFERLQKQISRWMGQQEWEEFWEEQERATSAEVEATGEALRRLLVSGFASVDADAPMRYESYRRKYRSPALAEIAALRDIQSAMLAQAFSMLDPGSVEIHNRERLRSGLPPL